MPQNPLDIFNIYDVTYGTGMSVVILALIVGTITLAIYIRNKSLTMLAILGIYEVAIFGALLTRSYISAQFQQAEFVIVIAAASGFVLLILKLLRE